MGNKEVKYAPRLPLSLQPASNNRPKYGRLATRKHLDCYLTTMVEVKVDEPPNTVVVVEVKHQ